MKVKTQLVISLLMCFSITAWATPGSGFLSPGYASRPSAPLHSVALSQLTLQGINAWSSNGPEVAAINSLAMGNPNTIYAGTNDGLFRSEDGGASWNRTGL